MKPETTAIYSGARVKLTAEAVRRHDRIGTVVGRGKDGTTLVLWDGIKTAYNYHQDFLRLITLEDL